MKKFQTRSSVKRFDPPQNALNNHDDLLLFSDVDGNFAVTSHGVFARMVAVAPDLYHPQLQVHRPYWTAQGWLNPQRDTVSEALIEDLANNVFGYVTDYDRVNLKERNLAAKQGRSPMLHYTKWLNNCFGKSQYTLNLIRAIAEHKTPRQIDEIVPVNRTVTLWDHYEGIVITSDEIEAVYQILEKNFQPIDYKFLALQAFKEEERKRYEQQWSDWLKGRPFPKKAKPEIKAESLIESPIESPNESTQIKEK